MRPFTFLLVLTASSILSQGVSHAQVVLYPNGKRVKVLSSRNGAYQLSGNQQRYIIDSDREVRVDPKKQELDNAQARARMNYPNEEESEESEDSDSATDQ